MDDLKNKMYNYEATPPEGVWEAIISELDRDEAKVIPIAKRNNKTFYYLAAASVAIILFSLIFFTSRSSKSDKLIASSQSKTDTAITDNTVLITVPTEEKTTVKNTELQRQNKTEKGTPDKKQNKEEIKITNDNLIASNTSRYITIEGQQGQPVKISSKMAMLVDSSETKASTKPIWNKKVNEWKEIMKVNTLAPTTVNFLDIVELTKTIKDK